MIRECLTTIALLAGLSLLATEARAEPASQPQGSVAKDVPGDFPVDESLERHRTAFEALTERALGRTSRRVRYDWRRDTVQLGLSGGLPAELNVYDSLRAGAFARLPVDGLLLELGLSYVFVSGSASSDNLALTPYRQPGRPDRLEVDFAVAYPLAEGVVTAVPGVLPSLELVLNAWAEFRYLIYPGAWADLDLKESLQAVFAGTLSSKERTNLEDERLPGMDIDPGRYGLLLGLGDDVYLQSGFFFSHRFLVTVPLLAGLTDTDLGLGFELDLGLGLAF